MIDNDNRHSEFSDLILWAFRIEFYMLHPAFAILYHILKTDTGDISPEDDYQNHIEKFAQICKQSGIKSITAVIMEVPCCSGLPMIVKKGMEMAGTKIPMEEVVISTRGKILERRQVAAA